MPKDLSTLYYVYGMCTMFYAIMTYFFVRKGDRLSRLVALLMCTLTLQCLSVNFFLTMDSHIDDFW